MPIIGTAGHVDHGKSTLVLALTGRDPDRWDEEKQRGLTIDLGFAWTELTPGMTVGFVDVPGHERFMKNMLAGVGALDVALFVVAADEGWMPQSEEHLSVLDLLDVRRGVIALTRADLVDADTLEIAELEIGDRIRATALESWPIVTVSPVTGMGIDELRAALSRQLDAAGPPPNLGRPRLWVDRSFVIAGAGVVVTGTLTGGSLHQGDTVLLLPGGREARIRGLQSHEQKVDEAMPGTRTAVNLSGVDRDTAPRGMLLTKPGTARTTDRVLAEVRSVREYDEPLTGRGAFHLHVGTGAWPVEVRPVTGEEIIGSGAVLLAVDGQVPVVMGDRFILREVGRQAVVAGGRVLDPAPAARLSRLASHVESLAEAVDSSPDDRAQALLNARGVARLDQLEVDGGGGRPRTGIFAEDIAVTEHEAARLRDAMARQARAYQEANPLRAGVPKASIASSLEIEPALIDVLLAGDDRIVDEGATVRTADFTGSLRPEDDAAWKEARTLLADSGLAVPRASQLGLDPELLHALVRSERLVQIAPDLVYLPEQIDEIFDRLTVLEDGFTVAEFRDELGVSRRHAIPVLEWLDAAGWTARRGDVRTIRKRPGRAGSSAPSP